MASRVCFVFLILYPAVLFAESGVMDTPPEGIDALFVTPSVTLKIEQWQPGVFNQSGLYLYPLTSLPESAGTTVSSAIPEPTPLPQPLPLGTTEELPTLVQEGDDLTPTNEMSDLTLMDSLATAGVMDDFAPLSLSLTSGPPTLTPEPVSQVVTLNELSSYSNLHWLLELYVQKHPEKAGQFNPDGQILRVNRRLILALDRAIAQARLSLSETELINVMRRMIAGLHINLFSFVEDSELLASLLEVMQPSFSMR